jgi:hypothetical protein
MQFQNLWQIFKPVDRFGTSIDKVSIPTVQRPKSSGLTGVNCFNFLLSNYAAAQILSSDKINNLNSYITKILKTDQIYSALDDFNIAGVFTLKALPGYYHYVWRDELASKASQKFLIFTLDSNIYFVWLSFSFRKPKLYPTVICIASSKVRLDYSNLISKSGISDIDKLYIKDFEIIIPHVNI